VVEKTSSSCGLFCSQKMKGDIQLKKKRSIEEQRIFIRKVLLLLFLTIWFVLTCVVMYYVYRYIFSPFSYPLNTFEVVSYKYACLPFKVSSLPTTSSVPKKVGLPWNRFFARNGLRVLSLTV
jgi:hypothetical protein